MVILLAKKGDSHLFKWFLDVLELLCRCKIAKTVPSFRKMEFFLKISGRLIKSTVGL